MYVFIRHRLGCLRFVNCRHSVVLTCLYPKRTATDGFSTKTTMSSNSSSPTTITVLYFAAASTSTGLTSQDVSLPSSEFPLRDLPKHLVALHPKARDLKKILDESRWSVDAEMVEEGEQYEKWVLRGGEEVAVICPVSGG